MDALWKVLISTAVAGAAIPVGGFGAHIEHLSPGEVRRILLRGVMAFGGGALLAAVALVLVPHGIEVLHPVWAVLLYVLGGVVFLGIDRVIEQSGASTAQLVAMLMDFVPEAIALGAACALGDTRLAWVLAGIIGLQNLPEGFNSYRELCASGLGRRRVLRWMALLALLGPAAGLVGFYLLADAAAIGGIALFAAGGITYLIFQDIAPASHFGGHWSPTLGAVLGFALGMAGQMIVG